MRQNSLDFVQLSNYPESASDRLIIFDVLTCESPVGYKGERIRMYVNTSGYSAALKTQKRGDIEIIRARKVRKTDSLLCPWE